MKFAFAAIAAVFLFSLSAHAKETAKTDAAFQLADTPLTQTDDGRELLEYLVSCALPEGQSAVFSDKGTDYAYPGSLGLAPEWQERPIGRQEQELVTACLLARTNAFGQKVRISIRGEGGHLPPPLRASKEERKAFPVYEATFFGNLFLKSPLAFVKPGPDTVERVTFLEASKRVCSLPAMPGVSLCGFSIVEQSTTEGTFEVEGTVYSNAVSTYLPEQKE